MEVYLINSEGLFLREINEWGMIELTNDAMLATPFYSDTPEEDLCYDYTFNVWMYDGDPLTILNEKQMETIRKVNGD